MLSIFSLLTFPLYLPNSCRSFFFSYQMVIWSLVRVDGLSCGLDDGLSGFWGGVWWWLVFWPLRVVVWVGVWPLCVAVMDFEWGIVTVGATVQTVLNKSTFVSTSSVLTDFCLYFFFLIYCYKLVDPQNFGTKAWLLYYYERINWVLSSVICCVIRGGGWDKWVKSLRSVELIVRIWRKLRNFIFIYFLAVYAVLGFFYFHWEWGNVGIFFRAGSCW